MNVIFGVALAALIIGSVLFQVWPVIEALSGGAAAFLGALVGAAAGLGAILVGALYNAKLNRDENKRLHDEQARTFAIAFRAELIALMADAKVRLHTLKEFRERDQPITPADTVRLDIPGKPVYANNTHGLGDLGDRVVRSMVAAHGAADHIRHTVAAMLAHPSGAVVEERRLAAFHRDFRMLIERAARAVNALHIFLGEPERYPDPKAMAAKADPADPAIPEVPAGPAESDAEPAP